MKKALKLKWIDFKNFNLEEFEYLKEAENGNLSILIPHKLILFRGPTLLTLNSDKHF